MSYQRSEQHLQNALKAQAAAVAAAQIRTPCRYCQAEFAISGIARHEETCRHADQNAVHCQNCNVRVYHRDKKKFCSKRCSGAFNTAHRKLSEATKNKIRQGLANHRSKSTQQSSEWGDGFSKHYPSTAIRSCATCSKYFALVRPHSGRKTCSDKCRTIMAAQNRENENQWGRRKIIPYWCRATDAMVNLQSTWEVRIAQWLDDNAILWTRPPAVIWQDSKGKYRRYYPDFYIEPINLYLDPKNPWVMEKDAEKLSAVKKLIDLVVGRPETIMEMVQERLKLVGRFGFEPKSSISQI